MSDAEVAQAAAEMHNFVSGTESEPTLYQLDREVLDFENWLPDGDAKEVIEEAIECGVLVPVEPDYEKMYDHIIKKLSINDEFTPQDAADVFETAIGDNDDE